METEGGFYISQIKQLQDRLFEHMLARHGIFISGGQGRILFVLWREDALSLSEISKRTSLAKNTVSIVVDGMVERGILQRAGVQGDRRQTLVSLTQSARGMRGAYEEVSQRMNALFYEGFSEEERGHFEASLAKILKTLTEAEQMEKGGKTV